MMVAGFFHDLKSNIFFNRSSLGCPAKDSIPDSAIPAVPWQLAQAAAILLTCNGSAARDHAQSESSAIPADVLNQIFIATPSKFTLKIHR
jgi:hypothetical protein